MAGGRGPWGGSKGGGSSDDGAGSGDGSGSEPTDGAGPDGEPGNGEPSPGANRGPRNPWLPPGDGPRLSASIEDIFRARDPRRGRGGGGGGGFRGLPQRPDGKSWLPLGIGFAVLVWVGLSSFHMLGPKDEGIVTTFGKYTKTIEAGVSMTLPWPIQSVDVQDVTSIKRDTIPDGEAEKLMLTSDQNLVDLSYLVRWNIKNLRDFRYRLADPAETVREVTEAAMRSAVADVTLDQIFSGAGRAEAQQRTLEKAQRVLDAYHAGVRLQGVEIKKADPPNKVIGAFQEVTAAQQDADRDRSNANAWAQQLLASAQGEAAQFDKVYEQYKLAPEVTKRRMYYETMERVLGENPKVIMEAKGINAFLPLPELRKLANPDDSSNVPTVTATPAAPVEGGQ